ncbi:MAG TPA: hypothetical protein VFB21_15275 [Chthonomonadaceae bacterium]|nr:hypothetical protein [Chthonomonadaceae bacterium]
METLPTDFKEFIVLLNSHEVRYLIVGGYAVAYHGYPRLTGDIDFCVEVSEENAHNLEAVLTDFGFAGLGLTASDFLTPGQIIQLGYPPHRIDIVTALSGVDFAEAWKERTAGELGGIPVHFIGKTALLANKAASGRPKDLADLDALS